jgi:hypothetical protein
MAANYYSMRNKFSWGDIGKLILFVAILVVIIWAIIVDAQNKQECIDRGGIIHEYNCSSYTTGSNGHYTTHTSCQWQCVER